MMTNSRTKPRQARHAHGLLPRSLPAGHGILRVLLVFVLVPGLLPSSAQGEFGQPQYLTGFVGLTGVNLSRADLPALLAELGDDALREAAYAIYADTGWVLDYDGTRYEQAVETRGRLVRFLAERYLTVAGESDYLHVLAIPTESLASYDGTSSGTMLDDQEPFGASILTGRAEAASANGLIDALESAGALSSSQATTLRSSGSLSVVLSGYVTPDSDAMSGWSCQSRNTALLDAVVTGSFTATRAFDGESLVLSVTDGATGLNAVQVTVHLLELTS